MAFLIIIFNKVQLNNKDNNNNENINERLLINSIQKDKKIKKIKFASYLAEIYECDW
jgi:hypothetical protein